jgi:hypothetical protein
MHNTCYLWEIIGYQDFFLKLKKIKFLWFKFWQTQFENLKILNFKINCKRYKNIFIYIYIYIYVEGLIIVAQWKGALTLLQWMGRGFQLQRNLASYFGSVQNDSIFIFFQLTLFFKELFCPIWTHEWVIWWGK